MRPIILLVDVASSNRTNWKSFLQNQSYEVFAAGDKETACLPSDFADLAEAEKSKLRP
jgi:hypothetical protein